MIHSFTAMSKKKLIEQIEKTVGDNDIVIMTNSFAEVTLKKKEKVTNVSFRFPHEMFADPLDVRSVIDGNITLGLCVIRQPDQTLSEEYKKGLQEENGFFGFTINQP